MESGICSTGKGHCCVDSSTPDGTACSAGGSGRSGSNCTPITSATGYRIRDRHLVHNGWKFWNTFVRNRGIALHQHHTVTGKPLSHGCVRLNEETARHIFCGARRHQTQVQVRGFARPSCSDSNLINEWRKDFRSAAENPSDGETPRARQIIRSNRRTTRRMLRAAYGRSLTEAEFSSGLDTLDIPRCQATAAQPTAEERRLLPSTPADANTVTVPNQILVSSGFERFLVPFTRDLRGATNLQRVRRVVRRHGRKLWQEATTRANLSTANTDDRPLYWSRLQLARALRQWQPRFQLSAIQRESLLDLLEQSSRGMDTATFRNRPDEKKILISGFDPFGLNNNIRRGNPSGAAALALDGKTISAGGISAQIQAVIFPVRFADFNAGIVESFFRPFLASNNLVDMIMTISMGGSTEFEVEEFAGRRRSAGSSTGNLGQTGGGTQTSPTVPPGVQAGPEFLRTTLPAQPIRGGLGRTTPLAGETEVTEIPQGGTQAARRTSGPTSGSMAVAGSGGGYLSNEIFYQSSLLRTNLGATVPVGHLHTPSLKAPLDNSVAIQQFNSHRDAIVQQVEQILESTLPHL